MVLGKRRGRRGGQEKGTRRDWTVQQYGSSGSKARRARGGRPRSLSLSKQGWQNNSQIRIGRMMRTSRSDEANTNGELPTHARTVDAGRGTDVYQQRCVHCGSECSVVERQTRSQEKETHGATVRRTKSEHQEQTPLQPMCAVTRRPAVTQQTRGQQTRGRCKAPYLRR